MVSPPPNLTVVSGTILARRPSDTLADWDVLSLAVDTTSPVAGLRDLVGPNIARTATRRGDDDDENDRVVIEISVRRELLGGAGPGWQIRLRARLTPDGPMAEPHPAGGDLAVSPP